jgi:hypothetical protein
LGINDEVNYLPQLKVTLDSIIEVIGDNVLMLIVCFCKQE